MTAPMECLSCGFNNTAEAKFCSQCSAPLSSVTVCSNCRAVNDPGSRFCNQCGHSLTDPQKAAATTPAVATAAAAPASFVAGRYAVKRFLGEGGKKRVYLCHDAKLDRDVAFAMIKTDGLNAEGEARIRREAQAMGRLGDHPNIVPVYDIGEENGQPYLVTQLMGGGDVEGLIEKAPDHRLELDAALRIADQICQAMEYAHSKG